MKRTAAFELSVAKLAKMGTVYFWTFTFRAYTPPDVALAAWAEFRHLLRRAGLLRPGLRVIEMHPGGHGAHLHVLVLGWWNIREIRPYAEKCGMGRISCDKTSDLAGMGSYLAKYLRKSTRSPELRRMRLYGWFGNFRGVPIRAIIITSEYTTFRRALGASRLPFQQEMLLRRVWEVTFDEGGEARACYLQMRASGSPRRALEVCKWGPRYENSKNQSGVCQS